MIRRPPIASEATGDMEATGDTDGWTDFFAAELAIRLAGADDAQVDSVIVDALSVVGARVRAQRAYITAFDEDRTIGNSHEWIADGVAPHHGAIQRIAQDKFPYSNNMARRGEVFRVPRLESLPDEAAAERDSFGSFGIKAVLQVPIFVNGDLLGLLGVNYTEPVSGWKDSTVAMIELVGRAVGITLNRRAADQRLRRALASAERANRTKDELIARASHELRTPLHAVIGFSEILELDGVDNDALRQIQASSAALLTMIDELLELGRLTVSDTSAGQREQVSDILAAVFDDLRPTAQAQSVGLVAVEVVSSRVVTSPLRVRQVLHCVVAAAISMAGEGGTARFSICGQGDRCLLHLCTSGPNSTGPTGLAFALAQSFIDDLAGTINWKCDHEQTEDGVVTHVEVVVDQDENL